MSISGSEAGGDSLAGTASLSSRSQEPGPGACALLAKRGREPGGDRMRAIALLMLEGSCSPSALIALWAVWVQLGLQSVPKDEPCLLA